MGIKDLKAGDEVVLYNGRKLQLDKVLRVTPKQVIVKWYTGAEMGFNHEGVGIGMWNGRKIFIATDEMKERTICEALYDKLYQKGLFLDHYNYKLIKEVYEFLKERKLID